MKDTVSFVLWCHFVRYVTWHYCEVSRLGLFHSLKIGVPDIG